MALELVNPRGQIDLYTGATWFYIEFYREIFKNLLKNHKALAQNFDILHVALTSEPLPR